MADAAASRYARAVAPSLAHPIPVVVGGPAERARAAMASFPEMAETLVLDEAELSADVRRWLDGCWGQLVSTFPEVAEYVEATAEALSISRSTLLARNHRVLLDAGVAIPDEECSVLGASHPEVGAFLVKNRDNPPDVFRHHTILEHIDPAWEGRSVLALSSFGAGMAVSSGINSAGFALADTAIPVAGAGPGILRYFLMDALLGRCTTVAEALELAAPLSHLGGTLTMVDATGAVAALDLAPQSPEVTVKPRGSLGRTNHYTGGGASEERGSAAGRTNSVCRRETIDRLAVAVDDSPEEWTALRARLIGILSSHDGDGALCRHGSDSRTNGTVVFTARPPTTLTSLGPPCSSPWVEWRSRPAS